MAGVKYEEVHLHAYESGAEAPAGLARYFRFYYNRERRHQALDYRTPHDVVATGAGLWICGQCCASPTFPKVQQPQGNAKLNMLGKPTAGHHLIAAE